MTARITSPKISTKITPQQIARIRQSAAHASCKMTKDQAQRLISHPDFDWRLRKLVHELANQFYILLSDEEAILWIRKYDLGSESHARQVVNFFRGRTQLLGLGTDVKIHAVVLPGCTVKDDVPLMGPTWGNLEYLQDRNFPDPPTEHALVSWIPRPLLGGQYWWLNIDESEVMLREFKGHLPVSYQLSFGSVNHVSGLALAHLRATGINPFYGASVRTETRGSDGNGRPGRLGLTWRDGSLYCDVWYQDEHKERNLGVFAVGVIKALER